jgi:hypothetical protein
MLAVPEVVSGVVVGTDCIPDEVVVVDQIVIVLVPLDAMGVVGSVVAVDYVVFASRISSRPL